MLPLRGFKISCWVVSVGLDLLYVWAVLGCRAKSQDLKKRMGAGRAGERRNMILLPQEKNQFMVVLARG